MILQDLSVLAETLQAEYRTKLDGSDKLLPEKFKQIVTKFNYNDTIEYYNYTMKINASSSLTIYIPNQWIYIAAFFVDYYNSIKAYREKLLNLFSKDDIKKCQDNEEFAKNLFEQINYQDDDKEYLIKFLYDYSWWKGGKTIDRNDYYVSPILALSDLVNASQTYVADICKNLAENPEAVNVLKSHVENNITKENHAIYSRSNLQVIFYGAPGTGKSNKIEGHTNDKNRIRTTFHPDSDYSTFVGAYKPTMEGYDDKLFSKGELINKLTEFKNSGVPYPVHKFATKYWRSLKILNIADKKEILTSCAMSDSYTVEFDKCIVIGEEYLKKSKETHIAYKYVPQAFLKAYVNAWERIDKGDNSPYYLVIEEINRGNCAQIFGDLFQLLDRGDNGESKYAICPDDDIRRYLAEQFSCTRIIPESIKNGSEMRLPSNLYIWATMNTSDQSLFPIDSAFKRRWDWEYMPIEKGDKDFVIEIGDKNYDWWNFISIINGKIDEITGSEDKKLGYWFAKPAGNSTIIKCDQFVSKVLFYLWNDVYKDYSDDNRSIFRITDGNNSKKVTFTEFFGTGREVKIHSFMQMNGINPISTNPDNIQDENRADDEAGIPPSKRDYSKYSINGSGAYGKGELVRRVIDLYCEQLSSSNANDVRAFWMELNTGIVHLIETEAEFNDRTSSSADSNKRAKELKLSNGESIYISTQVGSGNIQTFISAVNAANIGFTIAKI